MIRSFRRSTRLEPRWRGLAPKVQPFLRSPQATAGRWILRSGPSFRWLPHWCFTSTVKPLEQVFHTSSIPAPEAGAELDFLMPRRAAANTAAADASVLHRGPQHYRVNIFRKSATLPVWFWECWYCRGCRCTCCCCAWGTCCVWGCCWMYPTVLCCGTFVCKNVDVVPPWTSPWFICGGKQRECEFIPGAVRLKYFLKLPIHHSIYTKWRLELIWLHLHTFVL